MLRCIYLGLVLALGLAAGASLVSAATPTPAPQARTLPYIFSTAPLRLDSGYFYGGEYRFGMVGGKLSPNGGPAQASGPPLSCEANPGTMLYNTSWSLLNVNFRLNGVRSSRLYLRSLRDSMISMRDSTVDDLVIFSFRAPTNTTTSTLDFENCALGHVQGTNAFAAGVRLKWSKCLFLKSVLTPSWTSSDANAEMLRNGSQVTGCRFVNCLLSYDFLAITQDCVFERCHLISDPASTPAPYSTPPPNVRLAWTQADNAELQKAPHNLVLENLQITTLGCEIPVFRAGDELQVTLAGTPTPLTSIFKSTGSAIPTSLGPVAAPPVTANPPGMPTVTGTLNGKICHVNGLLVQETGTGAEAGFACRMNATAMPAYAGTPLEARFNQDVGESMAKALHEVTKWVGIHYTPPPGGALVEIAFEDKYTGKDGPSAAVACALLINGLVTGQETDAQVAVTGDMNADGEIQPIGGVPSKIRGATNGRCKYLGLPAKNENNVGDVLLLDGPAPLYGIQIFSLQKIDQAIQLANTPRSAELESAMQTFASVQDVLGHNRLQAVAMLHNPYVIAKLRSVLQAAPNHLSAKYLLLYGTDRLPRSLSLAGSLDGIDNGATALIAAIRSNEPEAHSLLHKDVIAEQLSKLKALRALLDPRIRPYAEAVVEFGELVRAYEASPPISKTGLREAKVKIQTAAQRAGTEWNQIIKDPRILEELKQ